MTSFRLTALAEVRPALARYFDQWQAAAKVCCEHIPATIASTGMIHSELPVVSLDFGHLDCAPCASARLTSLCSSCLAVAPSAETKTFRTGSLSIDVTLCDTCLTTTTETGEHHA